MMHPVARRRCSWRRRSGAIWSGSISRRKRVTSRLGVGRRWCSRRGLSPSHALRGGLPDHQPGEGLSVRGSLPEGLPIAGAVLADQVKSIDRHASKSRSWAERRRKWSRRSRSELVPYWRTDRLPSLAGGNDPQSSFGTLIRCRASGNSGRGKVWTVDWGAASSVRRDAFRSFRPGWVDRHRPAVDCWPCSIVLITRYLILLVLALAVAGPAGCRSAGGETAAGAAFRCRAGGAAGVSGGAPGCGAADGAGVGVWLDGVLCGGACHQRGWAVEGGATATTGCGGSSTRPSRALATAEMVNLLRDPLPASHGGAADARRAG